MSEKMMQQVKEYALEECENIRKSNNESNKKDWVKSMIGYLERSTELAEDEGFAPLFGESDFKYEKEKLNEELTRTTSNLIRNLEAILDFLGKNKPKRKDTWAWFLKEEVLFDMKRYNEKRDSDIESDVEYD